MIVSTWQYVYSTSSSMYVLNEAFSDTGTAHVCTLRTNITKHNL